MKSYCTEGTPDHTYVCATAALSQQQVVLLAAACMHAQYTCLLKLVSPEEHLTRYACQVLGASARGTCQVRHQEPHHLRLLAQQIAGCYQQHTSILNKST